MAETHSWIPDFIASYFEGFLTETSNLQTHVEVVLFTPVSMLSRGGMSVTRNTYMNFALDVKFFCCIIMENAVRCGGKQ